MSNIEIDEKVICSDCVENKFLGSKIRASETKDIECSYCSRIASTMELYEVAQLFDKEFQENYQVADNFLRREHGFPDVGDELCTIIKLEVTPVSDEISEDLLEMVRASLDGGEYGERIPLDDEEPLFVKTGVADHWLHRRWQEMQDSLRTKIRFVNQDAIEVLRMVFDKVDEDVTQRGESLIVEIGAGHELSSLYRARVFQNDDALQDALTDPENKLGPPPPGKGDAGRMNAKGISIFYGANSIDVAIAEVRPPVGSKVAVTEFKILRSLRLLDLTRFRDVSPIIERSMFDDSSLEKAQRQKFITRLEEELTKPVMPEHSDDGYLITQVISDYLASHEKLNLDGLIFRSVQVADSGDKKPLNVALFNKATIVKKVFKIHGRELTASLFEITEEGDDRFSPQIYCFEDQEKIKIHNDWDFLDPAGPTLELIPQSIAVCEIQAISFGKETTEVELTTYQQS